MSPGASNRHAGALRREIDRGEPLGGNRHPAVMVEAGQPCGVADVSRFHAIKFRFPCRAAYRGEAPGTGGVDRSILVHTMGKFKIDKLICRHSRETSGTHREELQVTAVLFQM